MTASQKSTAKDFFTKQSKLCTFASTCPHINPIECARCFVFYTLYVEEAAEASRDKPKKTKRTKN